MKFRISICLICTLIVAILMLDACKKDGKNLANYHPTYLSLNIPAGFPQPVIDIFKNNPLTEEGFQLGKKLFYDGRLSKDGHFPCASCHQTVAAYATFDHQFSHGYDDAFTTRNAPALFNLAWMKEMHWDGEMADIEQASLKHITNKNEMGETIENVLKKISADTAYLNMFTAAFGDNTVTSQRMAKSLAQFTGSIQSFNSKYDLVKRGETSFTIAEQNGYNTFKANCNTCHTEPLFTDNSFRNNGLSVDILLNDKGLLGVTHKAADSLKFKVPSLRNIAVSYPYMHDGRLFSILQTIEHYRTQIVTSQPTLDPLLKNSISITNQQKADLAEFLSTLTDNVLLQNKRFQQP